MRHLGIRAAFLCLVPLLAVAAKGQGLYDIDAYRSFYLTFKQSDWYAQLRSNYGKGIDIKADLRVGSKTYQDVGVRFRGASSYYATGNSQKKSFNLSMDSFVSGQDLMGYDSLNLSNGYNDPTFTREVVAYRIFRRYLPAPKANYIKLYINNAYWGVYMNVQQPDKTMMREWFKDGEGNRYRCDPPSSRGRGKAALQWLGTTLQNYKDAYELKSPQNATSWVDVMNACNVLNNTPTSQLPQALPPVIDVDRALWYLAINNLLVNLDCYIGRGNDYYLYHDTEHGSFAVMPWDMNESFGGYNAGMSVAQLKVLSIYWQVDNAANRPLMNKVLNIPQWRERYIAHYRTLLDEVFDWSKIGAEIAKYQSMIEVDVRADTKRLYPLSYFKGNLTTDYRLNSWIFRTWVPGLKPFIEARRAYLLGLADLKKAVPTITGLGHAPAKPSDRDIVYVTARVSASAGTATLYWRAKGPFGQTRMFDDGKHGDGAANDGVFGAAVSPQRTGTIVQYYVGATANGGGTTFAPRTAGHRAPSWRIKWPRKSSTVLINEFVAKNNTGIVDEKGQFEDWIELANTGPRQVDIGGYYMTDDLTDPTKWQVPSSTTLPAGSILLVWADDDVRDGPMHANFKLAAEGETVALFDSDGRTLLDVIEFGQQQADISTGRLFDGQPVWVTFPSPSPRKLNAPSACGVRLYSALNSLDHRVEHSVVGAPKIASTTTLRLRKGFANGAFVELLAGGAGYAPWPGTNITFLFGSPLLALVVAPADATGGADIPLPIPDDPGLVGLRLYVQAIAVGTAGFAGSNAAEITFCPK